MEKKLFKGLIPPMVTPLNAKRQLDKAGVKKMVKHLVDGGVDGIFLLGTTGEGPHLSYAIRRELVKLVCQEVRKLSSRPQALKPSNLQALKPSNLQTLKPSNLQTLKPSNTQTLPVLVGITETDLEDALAFAKDCKAFGAAGVVAAPPYYFKLTQAECVAWFTEMADRSPLPVVVYDMPAHTDTVIEPATIAKLAAHRNIVAMKDSSSVIALFNKFRVALAPFKDKFSLFMGPDEAMGEAVLLGADGGVCTGANLWPAAFKAMYEAAKTGDVARVRELQTFTTTSSYLLYGLGQGQIGFLKGVKAALAEMGLIQNVLAAPFKPFTGKELVPVKAAVKALRRDCGRMG